jgi:hypothetical protein
MMLPIRRCGQTAGMCTRVPGSGGQIIHSAASKFCATLRITVRVCEQVTSPGIWDTLCMNGQMILLLMLNQPDIKAHQSV